MCCAKKSFSLLSGQTTYIYINIGLFISPSGISELDCATTKTDTAERSISTERERDTPSFCPTLEVLDMLLSAVSVLVVAQAISEVPEGLMNNPVYIYIYIYIYINLKKS